MFAVVHCAEGNAAINSVLITSILLLIINN